MTKLLSCFILVGTIAVFESRVLAKPYAPPGQNQSWNAPYFLLNRSSALDEPKYTLRPGYRTGLGRSYGMGSGGGFQSTSTMVASGVLAFIPGFGVGHAVQGRWTQDGWRYTVGELASVGIIALGFVSKSGELVVAGAIGFLYLKVAEMVSIFGGPHMPGLRWLAATSSPCPLNPGKQQRSAWGWCLAQSI